MKSILKVRRHGIRKKKKYHEVSFYISNKIFNYSTEATQIIRNHWLIENKLHWSKDTYFKEDNMTIKEEHKASILALINSLTISYMNLILSNVNANVMAYYKNRVPNIMQLFRGVNKMPT